MMKKLIVDFSVFSVTVIAIVILIISCTKDDTPQQEVVSLQQLLKELNIEPEVETLNKANGNPTDVSCLGCTYFISGRDFPIDSVRAGSVVNGEQTLQYYLVDTVYNFRTWLKFYNIPGSIFVNCDFSPQEFLDNIEPCLIDTSNRIPLNNLVKVAVVSTSGDILEFYPESYTGTFSANNIEFLYQGKIYKLSDPLVTLTCP